ncbi:MAG: glutamine-hydrolyzing GMP synthase [Bacilli bacterium]|nr:glutamine-hydrolyzing GMP synthase [Bacilli bacterium]
MEKIIVVDFGGQYTQLIARRVRACGVFSEILPCTAPIEKLTEADVKGLIFTGGPASVYAEGSPHLAAKLADIHKPILAICYGAQEIAFSLGGLVGTAPLGEYGSTEIELIQSTSPFFYGINKHFNAFMSHRDQVLELPEGYKDSASSATCPHAAFSNEKEGIYCTQFHPEVTHTEGGQSMISNFIRLVCGCKCDWNQENFIETQVKALKEQLGDKKVLCALSGGLDSSVTAALLEKAIGSNLYCVFVDHGLLRYKEAEEVCNVFGNTSRFKFHFIPVNAKKVFLDRLEGVTDPEEKRKIIGKTFIDVFAAEREKLRDVTYLAQGTIYPDRVESGLGKSALIKSHHNVGGLPKSIPFEGVIEPLRDLFKDEVQQLGIALGLPRSITHRQPFPGPGLAVRIAGTITEDKIRIVQEADHIFVTELQNANIHPSQYFAALTNLKTVGVKGDERSYEYAVALRAVDTDDFMTASPTEIPYSVLRRVSERIVNEVRGVNRVYYDYSSKPPATIELE